MPVGEVSRCGARPPALTQVRHRSQAPAPRRKGRVVIVVDATWGSACLDALDIWKRLGAMQVGVETSADSLGWEAGTSAGTMDAGKMIDLSKGA